MAKINKAALKAYFQTGKIPTQAQFETLVDSFINNPSTDITERPNQNLFFGDGEDNPYIQGIRTINKEDDNSNNVVNMWIFSTYNNNDCGLAIPMFILMRTSTKNPGLLPANNGLRYCIPNVENIETFVQRGVDCNTSIDDDIFSVIYNWEFKFFGENFVENPFIVYKYSDAQVEVTYNAIFECHTVYGINASEYNIPTSITTVTNYTSKYSSNVYVLDNFDNILKLESTWEQIKANIDSVNYSQVDYFIHSNYKSTKNVE